jgi:hypothetical protein
MLAHRHGAARVLAFEARSVLHAISSAASSGVQLLAKDACHGASAP